MRPGIRSDRIALQVVLVARGASSTVMSYSSSPSRSVARFGAGHRGAHRHRRRAWVLAPTRLAAPRLMRSRISGPAHTVVVGSRSVVPSISGDVAPNLTLASLPRLCGSRRRRSRPPIFASDRGPHLLLVDRDLRADDLGEGWYAEPLDGQVNVLSTRGFSSPSALVSWGRKSMVTRAMVGRRLRAPFIGSPPPATTPLSATKTSRCSPRLSEHRFDLPHDAVRLLEIGSVRARAPSRVAAIGLRRWGRTRCRG